MMESAAFRLAGLALMALAAGCARDQDYIDVMNDQEAAWKETTEILKTIKDPSTMAQAKVLLDVKEAKFEDITRRANALPKPPPAKAREWVEQNKHVLGRTMDFLKAEAQRVGRLPGGAEFLKQFKSTKSLLSAVTP